MNDDDIINKGGTDYDIEQCSRLNGADMNNKSVDITRGNMMFWKGQDVSKMTKAELIQALYEMEMLYSKVLKENSNVSR